MKRQRRLVAVVGSGATMQRIQGDLSTDPRHRGLIVVRDHYELHKLRAISPASAIWLDWGASPLQKEFLRAARFGEPATIEQAREALHG